MGLERRARAKFDQLASPELWAGLAGLAKSYRTPTQIPKGAPGVLNNVD